MQIKGKFQISKEKSERFQFLGSEIEQRDDTINLHQRTVQAIRNITNFSCKKFIHIRTNFVLKFVHKIREKFVHESICLKITFLRKRYGESISIINIT